MPTRDTQPFPLCQGAFGPMIVYNEREEPGTHLPAGREYSDGSPSFPAEFRLKRLTTVEDLTDVFSLSWHLNRGRVIQ
jgi:hypothetical protein